MAPPLKTATGRIWAQAQIDAPDATYTMAQARLNTETGVLTVHNLRGSQVGYYQLTDPTITGETLDATTDTGGPIRVIPDRRCACSGGYKKVAR